MLTRHNLDNALDSARATQYDTDNLYDTENLYDTDHPWPALQPSDTPVATRTMQRKRPSLPPIPPFGGGEDRGKRMGSEACDLVVANLSAYQDDELDVDQRAMIEVHLQKCDDCASVFAAIQTTDRLVEREWREDAPLPSSLEFAPSIDAIMQALPPVPVATPQFEPKRVHARTRWMRFATGLMGLFTFCGMLLSSYAFGFANGRRSLSQRPGQDNPLPTPSIPSPVSALTPSTSTPLSASALSVSALSTPTPTTPDSPPLSTSLPPLLRSATLPTSARQPVSR